LRGVVEVRPALVVVAFELFQVDPQLGGSGAAGKFMRRRHKSKSNRWCGRQSNPCRPVVAMAGAGEKPGPARQGRVRWKICGTRWNLGGTRPYLTSGCASAWQCANARNRPAATTAVLRLARFRSLGYNMRVMIRALLLIFDSSRTWEKIKNDAHSVGRISVSFLFPLLALTSSGEALGLIKLGMERGVTAREVKVSPELALRYELVQIGLSLVIVYLGAVALQKIGASFHRQHRYTDCFTTLAYAMSPLYLLRLLDGLPVMNTWVCY